MRAAPLPRGRSLWRQHQCGELVLQAEHLNGPGTQSGGFKAVEVAVAAELATLKHQIGDRNAL